MIISGRDEKSLSEASEAIGSDTLAVRADVSKIAEIENLFAKVKQRFAGIDILFANAGVAKFSPVQDATEAHFDENMDINFKGAFFTVQKGLPLLRDGGAVIFNTSVVDQKGWAGTSVYSASKAALRSLTRTLAAELVGRRIRVNAVAPGPISTPIYGRMGMPADALDQFASGIMAQVPMKRFGDPDEIAKAVAFLASDEASYITGVELNIDGGLGQL